MYKAFAICESECMSFQSLKWKQHNKCVERLHNINIKSRDDGT